MKNFFSKSAFFSIFEWSFFAFLFFLPWQTVYIIQKKDFASLEIFASEILFCITAFLFFIWYFQNKKQKIHWKWLSGLTFLFVLFNFLSTLWAAHPLVAFFQAVRITEVCLFIFLLSTFPFHKQKALLWFIAGATFQALLGIYQFLTQSTFAFKWLGLVSHPVLETGTSVIQSSEAGRWLRAYGAFPHPNVLGGYLIISIIFTSLLFLQKNIQYKKVLFFCLLIQCAALFFTFSRSAWLAGIIWGGGLLFFTVVKKYKKQKFWVTKNIVVLGTGILALVGFLSVLYFPLLKTRIEGESYHEVRSREERVAGPKFAYAVWKTRPFVGTGAGNYVTALAGLSHQESWVLQPVHIVPLLFLSELGLIGFSLFVLVLIFYFKKVSVSPCTLLLYFSMLPLFFLDHYFYSLPGGILLCGLIFAAPQLLHTLSPPSGEE